MGSESKMLAKAVAAREKFKAAFPGRVTGANGAGHENEICYSWYVKCLSEFNENVPTFARPLNIEHTHGFARANTYHIKSLIVCRQVSYQSHARRSLRKSEKR